MQSREFCLEFLMPYEMDVVDDDAINHRKKDAEYKLGLSVLNEMQDGISYSIEKQWTTGRERTFGLGSEATRYKLRILLSRR